MAELGHLRRGRPQPRVPPCRLCPQKATCPCIAAKRRNVPIRVRCTAKEKTANCGGPSYHLVGAGDKRGRRQSESEHGPRVAVRPPRPRRALWPSGLLFCNSPKCLLPVLLPGLGNRWTCRGKVLWVHDRAERDLCVEREKPRLGDSRNLR